MNNKIKEIKSIIDEVFNKYKKSIKKLRLELYPNYKFPSYPVWRLDDENKIIEEIIKNIIEKFPELKPKEKNIYAGLKARFLLTKQEWPAKEYFNLNGAFDEPLSAVEEFYSENINFFEQYLNLVNESKNNNWKNEITNIVDQILQKSSNDYEEESNEEVKEITNTRILIECTYIDKTSIVEIEFKDIEIKLRRPTTNYIEIEYEDWIKKIPINKAQEIIKIWKNRK